MDSRQLKYNHFNLGRTVVLQQATLCTAAQIPIDISSLSPSIFTVVVNGKEGAHLSAKLIKE